MDADYYVSIIKENYKGMKSLGIEGWLLQFDNDPKYKNTNAKNYLKIIYINYWLAYLFSRLITHREFLRLITSKSNRKKERKKSELVDEVEMFLTNLIWLLSIIKLNQYLKEEESIQNLNEKE